MTGDGDADVSIMLAGVEALDGRSPVLITSTTVFTHLRTRAPGFYGDRVSSSEQTWIDAKNRDPYGTR